MPFFLISSVIGFSACGNNNAGQAELTDVSTNDSVSSSKSELVLEATPILSLNNNNKVIPLSMNMAYKGEEFSQKLIQGLTAASKEEGPYLVHCVEGKDRTGYVCMVLEALAGSSYQEMIDDYMVTYDNYYLINQASDPKRYGIIKEKYIDKMLSYVAGFGNADNIETADYAKCAREYLLAIGMEEADIDALKARLV